MADIGKITTDGFGAGAIQYVVLGGFVPNPGSGIVDAGLVTHGFGTANAHRPVLFGFVANPGGGGGASGFCIFGGAIVAGGRVREL